jgi:acyl-CoA synthetase (NDP forming)
MSTASAEVLRASRIRSLLRPQSIALVGASADLGKINGRPLEHLLGKGYAGRILPVNPKYEVIAGLPCVPTIAALPEAADLAVVMVPAAEVLRQHRRTGPARRARGGGLQLGLRREPARGPRRSRWGAARWPRRRRKPASRCCGPNCLGFVNAFENVYATFSQYADGETGAGPGRLRHAVGRLRHRHRGAGAPARPGAWATSSTPATRPTWTSPS